MKKEANRKKASEESYRKAKAEMDEWLEKRQRWLNSKNCTDYVWKCASRFRHEWKGREGELFKIIWRGVGISEEKVEEPRIVSEEESEEWARDHYLNHLLPKELASLPKKPNKGRIRVDRNASDDLKKKISEIQIVEATEYSEALMCRLFKIDPKQVVFRQKGKTTLDREKFLRAHRGLGKIFTDENWRILRNWKFPCEPQMHNEEMHGLEKMRGDKPLRVLGYIGSHPTPTERKRAMDKYRQKVIRLCLRPPATKNVGNLQKRAIS